MAGKSTLQTISEQARDILLGISAYAKPKPYLGSSYELDSPEVIQLRENFGGQLVQPAISKTRWYMSDVESAERIADNGDMSLAGRLMHAARKDGKLAGVLSTRTGGLVRLPRRFRGDPDVVADLELGHDEPRSVFDEMFPPSELALLAADGLLLGVGVAELVPVKGRAYPVMVRLDPQFLRYQWYENTWYYNSSIGRLPITPGDGKWILHVPGGRVAPWQAGLWRAVGQAYVRKQHAAMHRDNWEAKLANSARAAIAPQGAAEPQKQAFFRQVMQWGVNTVFGMTPGYDVKLIESNGRGWESFAKTIQEQNEEYIIAIAGQMVTTDGGAGFQNSDIHKTIRADLIKETGDGLAYTLNTQGIPVFVLRKYGESAILEKPCAMEYDVTPPKDRNSEASSMVTTASAVDQLTSALSPHDLKPDVKLLCEHFAIPLEKPADVEPAADAPDNVTTLELVTSANADTPEDTALNGAQVTSLVDVIRAVAAGEIPRDAALGVLKRAYLVDDAGAEELLGSAGAGFVPTAAAAPAPKPAAPAAPAAAKAA